MSGFLLVVIYLGFVSLGLPDGTFGIAWPAMYPELALPIGLAGTIIIVGTLLSGASGFISGRVTSRFGTGPVVMASCLLTGLGLVAMGCAHEGLTLYLISVPLGIGATLGPLVMGYAIGVGLGWLAA
ncbi:MAG: hypothetical protein WC360_07795 [Opitutales bacterium]